MLDGGGWLSQCWPVATAGSPARGHLNVPSRRTPHPVLRVFVPVWAWPTSEWKKRNRWARTTRTTVDPSPLGFFRVGCFATALLSLWNFCCARLFASIISKRSAQETVPVQVFPPENSSIIYRRPTWKPVGFFPTAASPRDAIAGRSRSSRP